MPRRSQWFLVLLVAVVAAAACSSSKPAARATTPSTGSRTSVAPTTRAPMTPGPAAAITGPITGGNGPFLAEAVHTDLDRVGYTNTDYFASGTATTYKTVGPAGSDGRWSIAPVARAPYRTRIVVRRPVNPARFNGTVLVEWLNVSSGLEAPSDFDYMGTELTRAGFAWVGVSAQKVGVSGGRTVSPVGGLTPGGLRGSDPARYGSLRHPGDEYALDIFAQVGRALRGAGARDALGPLHPKRLIAVGQSQSAWELTTYVDAIQPATHIFDGFVIHSRFGGGAPLNGGFILGHAAGNLQFRTDIDVPVLMIETETDEAPFGYFPARQPDTDHIRLWDLAGTSHADAFVAGGDPHAIQKGFGCSALANTAPTHWILDAVLATVDKWVRTGTPPPSAPRMAIARVNGKVVIERDARGNAIGGVRTAANDVAIAALSGIPSAKDSSLLCAYFGSTRPFDHATLVKLYRTKQAYLAKFRAATDKAIAAGYLLAADRAAILAEAASAPF